MNSPASPALPAFAEGALSGAFALDLAPAESLTAAAPATFEEGALCGGFMLDLAAGEAHAARSPSTTFPRRHRGGI